MTQPSERDVKHQGTLWMIQLDAPLPDPPTPRVPATFARAGPEIAGEIAPGDPASVLQRFAMGRRCYTASVGGRLAAYGWVSFDEEAIGELESSIHLQEGEAYIWGCETLAAYRGQRLYPALLAYMLAALQADGVHRVWIGADADNLASQSGLARAGFQPIADAMIESSPEGRRLLVRAHPGAPEEAVATARRALLGM
ncbi:MAG TPA: GNAT family N-acetyltransferase [Ktedonobacteraceae bacterium]|nr:GNAT family N-acetyltransferase [Ktedonobacteraceae bacterium]